MKSFSVTIPKFAALVFVIMLIRNSEADISCNGVINDLKPCVNYLVSGSGKPPADCCAGAKALVSAATDTADKKAACECIKSAAGVLNPNTKLAQDLPENCGITLPFDVSATVDCSKISLKQASFSGPEI